MVIGFFLGVLMMGAAVASEIPVTQETEGVLVYSLDEAVADPVTERPVNLASYGTYGTLVIYGTSINLAVDLIDSPGEFAFAQGICDDPNRGVVMDYSFKFGPCTPLVADHKHQGFSVLYDLQPGAICEMFYPDGTSQKYVLRDKLTGANNEEDIVVNGGEPAATIHVNPDDKEKEKPEGEHEARRWLCMYTCNPEGWWSVTVTFWEML